MNDNPKASLSYDIIPEEEGRVRWQAALAHLKRSCAEDIETFGLTTDEEIIEGFGGSLGMPSIEEESGDYIAREGDIYYHITPEEYSEDHYG